MILRPGTGNVTVNNKPFETYFFDETHRMLVKQPLEASDTLEQIRCVSHWSKAAECTVRREPCSMALRVRFVEFSAELRGVLKKAGFLTRDPRMKERKKYGQPGARKRFQFSKR